MDSKDEYEYGMDTQTPTAQGYAVADENERRDKSQLSLLIRERG